MKKLLFLWLWWGLPAGAWAQACSPTDVLGTHFRALDANGREVTTLCVGQPVRFEPLGRGSNFVLNQLYYLVYPGTSALPNPCVSINTPATQTYTPTAAGPVTVVENYNPGIPGVLATYYYHNYDVQATPPPTFTVVPCAGNVALLTVTDATYASYALQGSGGLEVPVQRGPNQVVPPAGPLTLVGRYPAGGLCEGRAPVAVRTLPVAAPPVLTSLTLAGPLPGTATFAFALPPDYAYTLLRDGQPVGPLAAGSTGIALPNATAGTYAVQRRDLCGTSPAKSDSLHTLALSAAPTSGHNLLLFDYGGPAASIRIERDNTVLATLPGTATRFDDPQVVCNTTYHYRVTATTASGGQSVNAVAVTAVPGAALPQPGALASFDGPGRVELSGFLPAAFPALPAGGILRYVRSSGGPGPAPVALATTRSLALRRDPAPADQLLAAPPCYILTLTDTCGTVSAVGPPTCPAILGAAAAGSDGLAVALHWQPYQGPDPAQPLATVLLSLAPDGTELRRVDVSGRTSFLDGSPPADRQIVRYRLASYGAGLSPGAVSYSNAVRVVRPPTLGVPTAFSPNGDGLNDVLEVKGRFLVGFTFFVIDRNGQEVFRTTDPATTWDGRINGHAPANGTYVWHFDQTDEDGQHRQRTGTVTIVQ